MLRTITIILMCLVMIFFAGLSVGSKQVCAAKKTSEKKIVSDERYITIDFDNVDINLLIKYISELTGKNFIVDPSVQGNVTIISPSKISETDAYRVFTSVLEIHGFTTVPSGSVIKILPSAAARSSNIATLKEGMETGTGDRVVTQLVPLKHTTPVEMQKVLQPLVSKTSVVIPHTQSGMLIITETLSNINRLMSIINTLDVEYSREEVTVIKLEHASAEKIAGIADTIFQKVGIASKGKTAAIKSQVKVVPYSRINALIVLAEQGETDRVRNLIKKLDTEADRGDGNIHVFYLQNATAVELAKVLNELPRKQQGEEKDLKVQSISSDVSIMADEETNALIITASRSEYNVIEDVIKKLDIPRRMVYLEALIMEVDTDKTFDVGVQWVTGSSFDDDSGIAVAGFSGENGYDNIKNAFGSDEAVLPSGFSLGVLKEGIEVAGVSFPSIGALLRAYKSDSDINIISTPQILTTDNKRAEISVGENVPYITSQNTTASEQDYTQYEYKDVATKLSITPHINHANTLRLEIETEVVKLKSTVETLTPTTLKRTATTTVIVNDEDTIVIGGIIGQDSTESEWKVPLLGDIPYLGWLFKTRTTTDNETNMFIFVTPHIVKNPADIAEVTLRKEDQIGAAMPKAKERMKEQDGPARSITLSDIGYEKLLEGRYGEAKEYLSKALSINPKNPFALINMGVAYEKEGAYSEAILMYKKVISTGTEEVAKSPEGYTGADISLVRLARENIEHVQKLKEKN